MTELDGVPYPDIEPFETGRLAVDDIHTLYWERTGSPDGVPVVVLHGGPGAGCSPFQRRMFDPEFYQIVLFDQRGCGKSTPNAELAGNTTRHLIADLEALREHFKIDRWIVCGGSWGCTLALAYAQTHPDHCLGLRLNGVWLLRRRDLTWEYRDGVGRIFPEAWQAFRGHLSESEREDVLIAYYRRLIDPDPAIHLPAAVAFRTFSAMTNSFLPDPAWVANLSASPEKALAAARIETHYKVNGGFMPPGRLLANIDAIRHLPGIIVQGRYDMVTPFEGAFELAKAWPEVELRIVTEANHAPNNNPVYATALAEASEWLKDKVVG